MLGVPRLLSSEPDSYASGDCACPTDGVWSAAEDPFSSQAHWRLNPTLFSVPLSDEYSTYFNPNGNAQVAVMNPSARAVLKEFAVPRLWPHYIAGSANPGFEAVLRQFAALGFVQPLDGGCDLLLQQPQTLTAWLHLTDACNLRCSYCYVHKRSSAMTPEVGRAAIDAVVRAAALHGFRTIKLKYAGGEATLQFDLIKTLHSYAQLQTSSHGFTLQEVLLSNGVGLSGKRIDFLRHSDIQLMISLDGVGAVHDMQRVFPDGHGSFAIVAATIERCLQHGLKPDLSVTVTGRNVQDLADVVQYALDRNLRFNFNFYRANECAAGNIDLAVTPNELIAGIRSALAVIAKRLPQDRLIDGLLDRAALHRPHEHACGAGHTYLAIDTRGQIARCHMELGQPVADVSANDPLLAIRNTATGFENRAVSAREDCRTCSWRHWCGGGCPLQIARSADSKDARSPFCNVYRTLLPELVHLEGLRLLKWDDLLPQ